MTAVKLAKLKYSSSRITWVELLDNKIEKQAFLETLKYTVIILGLD